MSGLLRYDSTVRQLVAPAAHAVLDQLSRTYVVEVEAPSATVDDWYVQVRRPEAPPVLAGYYAETLQQAAFLVAASLGQSIAA